MGRIPPTPGGPWTGILLAASVLGSCLQPAPAQTPVTIVLTPPSPVAGGGVSLAPEPATQGILTCGWYRSATADENSRILSYIPGPPPVQQNGSAHTGRETAGPGCALHIAGLTLSDTGSYTVRIESPTSPGLGSVYLRVSEPAREPRRPGSQNRSESSTVTVTYGPDSARIDLPGPIAQGCKWESFLAGLSRAGIGIIIGSLAGAALVGVGAYFLYSRCRNKTPTENGAPVLVYENLSPTAGAGPVAQPGSPPDPGPTYETLQPRQPDLYEELKK